MKLRGIQKLLRDRGGVSAVISNVILVGAVIASGFTVVAWTNSRSNAYITQYSESINSDVDKLRERVSFEYVFYNDAAKNLSVYLMNSGKADHMNFTTVYVSSNASPPVTFTSIQLKFLNGTPTPDLGVSQEGYFALSSITLQQNSTYTVKVVTRRGSSFANMFVA
ncbi:hypothetical protein MUP01_09200 [Candidatus Bathyarchaeota archaeon]|nr:hypothetical protein [Candidatus Bathyarchaeota archaeon]